jgi:Zn-dependent metalloprotease
MKRKFLAALLSLSMVMSVGLNSNVVQAKNSQGDKHEKTTEIVDKLSKLSEGKLIVYANDNSGNEILISGKLSEKRKASGTDALRYLNEIKELLNLEDIDNSFKVASIEKDNLDFTHVKLHQVVKGTRIKDKEINVHFNKAQEIVAINGQYENKTINIENEAVPAITESKAVEVASNAFKYDSLRKTPTAEKEILLVDGKAYETFKVNVQFDAPAIGNWDVYIDAHTENIIKKTSRIRFDGPAAGSGVNVIGETKNINLTLTSSKYYMQDQTKPMTGQIKTYTANSAQTQPGTIVSNTTSTFNTTTFKAAVSAHDYASSVYDFYKNLFSRNSIDNNGMSIISTVHYGSAYNNAFWDGTQMVYGDGDGSTFTYLSGDLDVVAHEMTHGVTERSANLNYENQSGALNESMSDVMGVLVQTYDKYNVKNGGTWTFNSADWVVGDQIYTPGTSGDALRSLANPTLYNQPAHMNSYQNLPNTEAGDWGGVHTNSGIPNKAGYLVAQAIGNEKTAKIYYRALTTYMTATTDFQAARNYLVQAATDLYGTGSAEVTAVSNAFDAVGIVPFADTYEPNGTIAQAYAVSSGTTYNSYLASSTDVDYYKLTTSASGTVNVTLSNLAGDYDLYLVNSSGTTLAKSENGSTTSETINYNASAAGTYYVKVVGYNGAYSTTKAYAMKLTFTAGSTSGDLYEPNDTTTQAYGISSGVSYSSYIYTSTDIDYYKFTVSTAKSINISLTTLPKDYDLYLYNSAGTLVAKSENGSTTSESITYSAAAGTYYVKVVGYNQVYSSTVKYTLKATY